MSDRVIVPGPVSGGGNERVSVSGPALTTYVMQGDGITLNWGWAGLGFQPTSISHAGSGFELSFLPCEVWVLELTDGFDVKSDGLEYLRPTNIGNESVTLTRTSGSAWRVSWDTGTAGIRVHFDVTIEDGAVLWGAQVEQNDTGARVRRIVGPVTRFGGETQTETLLRCQATYALQHFPVTELFNLTIAEQDDPNLNPVFTDGAFSGYTGIILDTPGTVQVDSQGFYDRAGKTWWLQHSTDTEGVIKGLAQLSNGEHLSMYYSHLLGGAAGNAGTVPYSIRWAFGATERPNGGQWLDMAEEYRGWLDAQDPIPEWWAVDNGWWANTLSDELLFCYVHYSFAPVRPGTDTFRLAVKPMLGDRTITVEPIAGTWTNDPLTSDPADREYIGNVPVPDFRVLRVEAGAGEQRIIAVDPPWYADEASTDYIFSTGKLYNFKFDPLAPFPSVEHHDKILAAIEDARQFLGLRPHEFGWHGMAGNYGEPDLDGLAPPYWSMGGRTPRVVTLNERLRAAGVKRIGYGYTLTLAGAADDDATLGIRRYRLTRGADFDPTDLDGGGADGWGWGGPEIPVTPENDICEAEIASRNMTQIWQGFNEGNYFDACFGRNGGRLIEYSPGSDPNERGFPSDFQKAREYVQRLKESASGWDRNSCILSQAGALASVIDVNGTDLLVDTPDEVGITTDGEDIGITAVALVEVAPFVTCAVTGERALLATLADLPTHPGYPVLPDGSPETFVLADFDFGIFSDENDNEIDLGTPIVWPGGWFATTENADVMSTGLLGWSASKTWWPFTTTGAIPVPHAFHALLGGKHPRYDITEKSYKLFFQNAVAAQSFMYYFAYAWHFGEMVSCGVGGGALDLLANWTMTDWASEHEENVARFIKELVTWDTVKKVREYRRTYGRYAGTAWGDGTALELLAQGDYTRAAFTTWDLAVWRRGDAGIMVAVVDYSGAESEDLPIEFTLSGALYPEIAAEGAVVYEIDKAGNETEVSGAIGGGNLALSIALPRRTARVFEVRNS